MYCENCRIQLPDNARACPFCGKATKVPPKAKNTKPVKALLIVVLAAVVIGAGALVIRGIVGAGTVNGVTQNGYDARQMIRVGKTTYMVMESSERRVSQILRIDEKTDSKAQEVYKISWPNSGRIWFYLICIKGNTLYYLEYKRTEADARNPALIELKSLDLKKEGSKPVTIALKLKEGKQIPQGFIEACEKSRDKKFSLEDLLEIQAGFDKNYIYIVQANGGVNGRVTLVAIDCTNGEVSFIEGSSLGPKEYWVSVALIDGYLYYERHDDERLEGLYRASLSDLKEEKLLDAPERAVYFSDLRVRDNSFFYKMTTYSSKQYGLELHHLDLGTRKDLVVVTAASYFTYDVSANTIYYFEQGDLRSCNYDGSNDKLVVKDRNNAVIKNYLYVLGDWVYYKYDDDWYRLKPGDGEFPSRSLN